MPAFLQLMRRQPQALIQAPSADLIKSDNEFLLPDPTEITCELEKDTLAYYSRAASSLKFGQIPLSRELLLHLLKEKGFRIYDASRVDSFMERYINHAHKNLKLGNDLWWRWVELKEYRHPLPVRVIENIKVVSSSNPYSCDSVNVSLFVSDIVLVTSRGGWSNCENTGEHIAKWELIPMKRKTEICFLRAATDSNAPIKESLIIDAWRGPTFSDEEAKI